MDKFESPENAPEGLTRELLVILAEECCEVGQRVSKALRFGLLEVQPGQDLTNAQRIAYEVGDIVTTVERLKAEAVLSQLDIDRGRLAKHDKLDVFLQNEREI